MLITKIGDINNKLNQEFKNCNLHIKNLPYNLTEEKLKEIFSKCGEVKSVKIDKFILQTKKNDQFVESEESKGFGYVCFTTEEAAKKAKEEFDGKTLPGFEESKRPILINFFMPKNERKQFLNNIQASQNQNYPYMPPGMPGYPPYMYPPMFPRNPQNRGHKGNYRKPAQPNQQQVQQPIMNQPQTQNINMNNNNNKEDEPNLEYLNSLTDVDAKRDYLGEYLFKKIEQHPIAHSKNLTVDIISRITGMILDIGDIKEIYDITINNDSITARINEALELLEKQ
jgi:polyadenylate-binding protein